MPKQKKLYTYRVTLDIPNSMKTHSVTTVKDVPNQFEAKSRASKLWYGHLFTGTFKYMKAVRA